MSKPDSQFAFDQDELRTSPNLLLLLALQVDNIISTDDATPARQRTCGHEITTPNDVMPRENNPLSHKPLSLMNNDKNQQVFSRRLITGGR